MGAVTAYRVFEDMPKEDLEKRFAAAVEEARIQDGTDPYSGSIGQKWAGIAFWHEEVFDTEWEALEWLECSGKWDERAAAARAYRDVKINNARALLFRARVLERARRLETEIRHDLALGDHEKIQSKRARIERLRFAANRIKTYEVKRAGIVWIVGGVTAT